MWYKILFDNEFAEYFMKNEITIMDINETQHMLSKYAEIVNAVSTAWTVFEISRSQGHQNLACETANGMPDTERKVFEFCYERIPNSAYKELGQIWHSIVLEENQESRYEVDINILTAEQCAVLIMYPFWSRMGGSFERNFIESGKLRAYLIALMSK